MQETTNLSSPARSRVRTLTMLLLALSGAQLAHADTAVCTPITAVPLTITQSGVYCLDRPLSTAATSGFAIRVQASDVLLDLNGFTISGPASLSATTQGVTTLGSLFSNITVRNGTVRGFYIGVYLGPGEGHMVDRVAAYGNTYAGLWLKGRGVVRDSHVTSTGGTTLSVPGIYGVVLDDQGSVASGNVVSNTCGPLDVGPCNGIHVSSAGNRSVVEANKILRSSPLGLEVNRRGIYIAGAESVQVIGNRLLVLNKGVEYGPGGSGPYRDNVCEGCSTSYTGGTNAGNNY